jgi:hypothetical protein
MKAPPSAIIHHIAKAVKKNLNNEQKKLENI